jgi:hypothetical protein
VYHLRFGWSLRTSLETAWSMWTFHGGRPSRGFIALVIQLVTLLARAGLAAIVPAAFRVRPAQSDGIVTLTEPCLMPVLIPPLPRSRAS